MQAHTAAPQRPARGRCPSWLSRTAQAVCVASAALTCSADDVAAVRRRLDALGPTAKYTVDDAGRLTAITIEDGSAVSAADVAAFAALPDLRRLQILDCRALDDAMVADLTSGAKLESLAVTNSLLGDASVEALAKAFPDLVELDLSSNTNLSAAAIKWIAELGKLRKLTLMQTRLNDLGSRRLAKLRDLETLDLRGNMEAGDMTLAVIAGLPKLRSLKHRSSAVTDEGLARLAESTSLESLLIQDFAISSAAGPHLAKLRTLESLEVLRCPGFGSEGVLALAGLPLTRLTLRDLPDVGDDALAVLSTLPALRRLALHELASVGDKGAARLATARQLQSLDIWSLPVLTDATAEVIAGLPAVEELSIRETGMTEAAALTFAALPGLQSLTFKNNGPLSAATVAKLKERRWKKLDLGAATAGGR